MEKNHPPVMGFAAPSGTGKTTLMENVIKELTQRGLRVAALKHGHHAADPDVPGKDTWRFRQAGAETVLFAGPERWFMIQDLGDREQPPIEAMIGRLRGHDLILIEGYKESAHPKIAIHRQEVVAIDWHEQWQSIVAIATDAPDAPSKLPKLPLGDPAAVADFIVDFLSLKAQTKDG